MLGALPGSTTCSFSQPHFLASARGRAQHTKFATASRSTAEALATSVASRAASSAAATTSGGA